MFQVCERRVTDLVPLNITYYLLEELVSKIRLKIINLCREDDTAEFFQEAPEVASQRVLYRSRLERLNEATKELAKF